MTVDEMIKELQELANKGYGNATVVTHIITDNGDEEVNFIEVDFNDNVGIY